MAAVAGRREMSVDELLEEAVALFLQNDAEAVPAFDEGVRQIEAGEFYTHGEVRAQLDALTNERAAA